MLKRWLRSIDWLAITASALLLCGLLFLASLLPNNPANHQQAQQTPDKKAGELLLGLKPEEWTALFTGLLTISTVGLWIVTAKGANTASQALTVLERPWLTVKGFKLAADSDAERGIKLKLHNVGRSPAFVTSFVGGCKNVVIGQYTAQQITTRFDASSIALGSIDLPLIGSAITQGIEASSLSGIDALRDELLERVRGGTSIFFTRGILKYNDVFGNSHETSFCIRYDSAQDSFIEYGGRTFNYLT